MQSPTDIRIAARAQRIERRELGEVVAIEVVRLGDDGRRVEVFEVATQVRRLLVVAELTQLVTRAEPADLQRPWQIHVTE